MSPPSFTRASKRFLALVLGLVLLQLLALSRLSAFLVRSAVLLGNDVVLDHQARKLERLEAVDVLLVGDSSLGNGLDAARASRTTGLRWMNLALTGSFGLGGSQNMIRATLLRARPRLIVIMHTLDVWRRSPSYRGYARSAERLDLPWLDPSLSSRARVEIFRSSVRDNLDPRALARGVGLFFGVGRTAPVPMDGDYLRQNGRWPNGEPFGPVFPWPAPSRLPDLEFLLAANRICTDAGVTLVYAHGPLRSAVVAANASYLERINALVRASGTRLLSDAPLLLEPDAVGDTEDHVAPASRAWSTGVLVEMLRPYL